MPPRSGDDNVARAHAADRRRRKGDSPRQRRAGTTIRDTRSDAERAVLISVDPEAQGAAPHRCLDELADLAKTAGAAVVGRLVQRREHPHPGSYLGTGKIDELRALCEEAGATLVIADSDLSPAQVRTLEDRLDLRVVDRSELIIDIFATHARTLQARLQVELAQLKYMAPRLKRMWTHLSRITGAGGIGSRGPGEKQIEVDRRIIKDRIRDLTAELRAIESRRAREVAQREELFKVSLVGYTNAGKSTLMRALTGADVFIADQLFATLDTRTRQWELEAGDVVLLSDTVGFIDKLPHHLVASFHATLEEVREADLLLHVADASDPLIDDRVRVVREVLGGIGAAQIPELLLLNKCDLVPDPVELTILQKRLEAGLACSAVTGAGLAELNARVATIESQHRCILDLDVPVTDGGTLAYLARVGRVLSRTYSGERCRLRVSVPPAAAGRLEPFIVP